jgi:hypothetical protein
MIKKLADWFSCNGQGFDETNLYLDEIEKNSVYIRTEQGVRPSHRLSPTSASRKESHLISLDLCGCDFWLLTQKRVLWDGTTKWFITINRHRRHATAVALRMGYPAIDFHLENPCTSLPYCYIMWPADQGLASEFVKHEESQ